MIHRLSDEALDLMFRQARTHKAWLKKPVSDELLGQLYDVFKWGPTSMNSSPARFVLLRSDEAKERLKPALSLSNIEKTMTAPVTVIIAYDLDFYDKLPDLFPQNPSAQNAFAQNPQLVEVTARRNSSLQGAYLMLAARALGLDCGPMSGFDNAKVDVEFFGAGASRADHPQEFFPEGRLRSNFLCNLGYGDPVKLHPRGPRLGFDEACVLL